MLGSIVLLLVIPLLLWAAGEVLARMPAVQWARDLWFGPPDPPPGPPGTPTCGKIGRPPDLPPRLSLHDRSALPLYDPGPGEPKQDDEFPA